MSTKKNGDILYAEDFNSKQDKLESGVNIKTVDGQSILGSGNITSKITVDSALSASSENPVQNKVINTALDGKQASLVSGTNIKTINNQSILGSGNITIEAGSSVTVDDTLSATSTNPVQNKVINAALENKQDAFTYDSGTWSTAFDKGINFEFKKSDNTLMNINVGSLLIKGKEIADFSILSANADETTQQAILSIGSADIPTAQGISFKGITPGGTKIPVQIFDVPAIQSPSNSSLRLFSHSDLLVDTTNYSMSWDSTSQAIKITFN